VRRSGESIYLGLRESSRRTAFHDMSAATRARLEFAPQILDVAKGSPQPRVPDCFARPASAQWRMK